MVRHALDATDKHARRESILAAARQLFLAEPGKLPSAARIAEAAGLAKGTVYLYFLTKEEIFMALLDAERGQLLGLVHEVFGGEDRPAALRIELFLDRYVEHLRSHPQMLMLEAQGYSVLERNTDLQRLVDFKLAAISSLNAAGAVIDTALELALGQGTRLLIHTYSISLGLWQALDLPDNCRSLLERPDMAILALDFHVEVRAALARYWRPD
ncbi:TetR family transcriptional regulator [Pseudomonas sp. dw_358]|uniref:TetR family transcriptional regulator n=1 Tax=Pseudomonas sp. dw_358 TaxID=2720083 RepID=UPI001BD52636|nr:TetR family transcriptional regulator [Pseudomonas sp. dw_358]